MADQAMKGETFNLTEEIFGKYEKPEKPAPAKVATKPSQKGKGKVTSGKAVVHVNHQLKTKLYSLPTC